MSSTYAHYQPEGPASLPSDYAILSSSLSTSFLHQQQQQQHLTHPTQPHQPGGQHPHPTHPNPNQQGEDGRYPRPRPTIGTRARDGEGVESGLDLDSDGDSGTGSDRTQMPRPKPARTMTERTVTERTPLLGAPSVGGGGGVGGLGGGGGEEGHCVDSDSDADGAEDVPSLVMFLEELAILTKYSLPVFVTHLLEYSLVITSVISIGHLSTTALAAISLGSMTASVSGFSIIQGFASALDTLLPSAWTSGRPRAVGLWAQRMTVVMFASLIPMLLVWWNAESILLALRQEPEVAHLASVYLRWVSLGLPAYAFNCISRRYFQSQGLFAAPTRIVVCVAPINAALNYLLVWGPEPIRLGFIGAPIATAISFNLISILSIAYGVLFTDHSAWHPLSFTSPSHLTSSLKPVFSPTHLSTLFSLGLSGVGQTASEWWAWELVALAASLLGPTVLAAQSVLLVSASTTFQAPFALSVAGSVRIGNLLGEAKGRRAGVAARTGIMMAFGLAGLTSGMFYVFRHNWAYLFNNDPEVVKLVAGVIPLLALFQVFDGTSAVASGILRAIGKQFFGALLNMSAYYVLGIPFGVYLAFWRHQGLTGLWIGLTVSLVYSATAGCAVCLLADWDEEVEKVRRRLGAGDGCGGYGAVVAQGEGLGGEESGEEGGAGGRGRKDGDERVGLLQ